MPKRWVVILVLIGFVAGGSAGWTQRPSEWKAGLWHTAGASVNAAKYGHAYESIAERVLRYPIYGGLAGAVCAIALVAGMRKGFGSRGRDVK